MERSSFRFPRHPRGPALALALLSLASVACEGSPGSGPVGPRRGTIAGTISGQGDRSRGFVPVPGAAPAAVADAGPPAEYSLRPRRFDLRVSPPAIEWDIDYRSALNFELEVSPEGAFEPLLQVNCIGRSECEVAMARRRGAATPARIAVDERDGRGRYRLDVCDLARFPFSAVMEVRMRARDPSGAVGPWTPARLAALPESPACAGIRPGADPATGGDAAAGDDADPA